MICTEWSQTNRLLTYMAIWLSKQCKQITLRGVDFFKPLVYMLYTHLKYKIASFSYFCLKIILELLPLTSFLVLIMVLFLMLVFYVKIWKCVLQQYEVPKYTLRQFFIFNILIFLYFFFIFKQFQKVLKIMF